MALTDHQMNTSKFHLRRRDTGDIFLIILVVSFRRRHTPEDAQLTNTTYILMFL